MSDYGEPDVGPLDAELAALVAAERERPGMPAAVQERLLDRLSVGIAGGGWGGAGGDGATAPTHLGLLARRLPFGLATFAAGALAGAGMHAALTSPRAPAPIVVRAVEPEVVPAPPPALPPSSAAQAPPSGAAKTSPRHPARAAAPPDERDTELAAERALVETARTAMLRGNANAALEALERDARQFPHGRMVEERESVRIQALARAGQHAEAKRLAARFHQQFPGSLLLPVVDAALQETP